MSDGINWFTSRIELDERDEGENAWDTDKEPVSRPSRPSRPCCLVELTSE